eukprot:c5836_g1_i2.p1 GENE.c5836_g1_i2~~c5836_g1_i2.p1  ORF type:complete len:302 (-),score=32.05 c5836_g1_i2:112-1017(-)
MLSSFLALLSLTAIPVPHFLEDYVESSGYFACAGVCSDGTRVISDQITVGNVECTLNALIEIATYCPLDLVNFALNTDSFYVAQYGPYDSSSDAQIALSLLNAGGGNSVLKKSEPSDEDRDKAACGCRDMTDAIIELVPGTEATNAAGLCSEIIDRIVNRAENLICKLHKPHGIPLFSDVCSLLFDGAAALAKPLVVTTCKSLVRLASRSLGIDFNSFVESATSGLESLKGRVGDAFCGTAICSDAYHSQCSKSSDSHGRTIVTLASKAYCEVFNGDAVPTLSYTLLTLTALLTTTWSFWK